MSSLETFVTQSVLEVLCAHHKGDEKQMIEWMLPVACWPPHRVTHPEKVDSLAAQFKEAGWGHGHEALVGYRTFCRGQFGIQLLSGSHRWEAAFRAGNRIPVVIVPEDLVERAWGNLELWGTVMGMGRSHGKMAGL